jgi:hypothetical protein
MGHFSPVTAKAIAGFGHWHSIRRSEAGGARKRARGGAESALVVTYMDITGFPEKQEVFSVEPKIVPKIANYLLQISTIIPNYLQISPFICKNRELSPFFCNWTKPLRGRRAAEVLARRGL